MRLAHVVAMICVGVSCLAIGVAIGTTFRHASQDAELESLRTKNMQQVEALLARAERSANLRIALDKSASEANRLRDKLRATPVKDIVQEKAPKQKETPPAWVGEPGWPPQSRLIVGSGGSVRWLHGKSATRGFAFDNMSHKKSSGYITLLGEVTNNTTSDYDLVIFTVSYYGTGGELLDTGHIQLLKILAGQTKSFSTNSLEVKVRDWQFKIDLEATL